MGGNRRAAVIIPPMPIPEFLTKWGYLIVQNPVAFIVFAGIIGAMVWWLASYRITVLNDRISGLKERNDFLESSIRLDSHKPTAGKLLTQEQYGQIVRYLQKSGCEYINEDGSKKERIICVQIPANSNENEATAYRLRDAIESAGWKAAFELRIPEERYQDGIWVIGPTAEPGKQPTTRTIIRGALASAGIQSRDEEEREFPYRQPELAFVILGKSA